MLAIRVHEEKSILWKIGISLKKEKGSLKRKNKINDRKKIGAS